MLDVSPIFDGAGALVQDRTAPSLLTLPSELVPQLLRHYGVLVFRGFRTSRAECGEVTARFSEIVKTVEVTGTQFVGYHGELMYAPFPPDLLCFYCEVPSNQGGETTLCDGVALWNGMPAPLRQFFATQPLTFRSRWSTAFLLRRLHAADETALAAALAAIPGVTARPDDEAHWQICYTVSAVRRTHLGGAEAFVNSILIALADRRPRPERAYTLTLADGSELPESLLGELVRLTDAQTHLLSWQRDDYVVVDNSRMLHGRRPGNDGDRRLINMHTLWPARGR